MVEIAAYRPQQRQALLDLSLRAWAPVFPLMEQDVPAFVYRSFYPEGWRQRQTADLAEVLDGEPDQGRRAITLVPDTHVVVLRASDIVPTVPQAVEILGKNPTRPMTWIAGGSAPSDIELVRVNGVHGPRFLRVVIVK